MDWLRRRKSCVEEHADAKHHKSSMLLSKSSSDQIDGRGTDADLKSKFLNSLLTYTLWFVHKIRFEHAVKQGDLVCFAHQLATMLKAGVPLTHCLRIAQNQMTSKYLRNVLGKVLTQVEEGNPLSVALACFPKVFSEIFIFMVRSGEVGGSLDEFVSQLASQLEKEQELHEKMKSAFIYPLIVLIATGLALIFMLIFVLPGIVQIIHEMGGSLPMATRFIMGGSDLIRYNWYGIPGVIIVLFFSYIWLWQNPKGRELFDAMRFKIPIMGSIYHKTIIIRFCHTLSVLLRNGVPIIQSLDMLEKTMENRKCRKILGNIKESIQEGQALAVPLKTTEFFPPLMVGMVTVGEETGSLDTMLERVGIYYGKEVGYRISRLSNEIEPFLIIVLGGIIGFIVLAVMLPIVNGLMNGLDL